MGSIHASISGDAATFIMNRLPSRPYVANIGFSDGSFPLPKDKALSFPLIQMDHNRLHQWLTFDLDYAGAAFAWEQVNLPPPSLVSVNRKNGHAHISYALTTPVTDGPNARRHPLDYYHAIKRAFAKKLNADPNYAGFIAKNPLSTRWHTFLPTGNLISYELGELAEWVDLQKTSRRNAPLTSQENDNFSRNVSLFDTTRFWAYKSVCLYRDYDSWFDAVHQAASQNNSFLEHPTPLPDNEVKHIARSVAKWVWSNQRFFSGGNTAFSARQAARGRKKGAAKRKQAIRMYQDGATFDEIQKATGLCARTLRNYRAKGLFSSPTEQHPPQQPPVSTTFHRSLPLSTLGGKSQNQMKGEQAIRGAHQWSMGLLSPLGKCYSAYNTGYYADAGGFHAGIEHLGHSAKIHGVRKCEERFQAHCENVHGGGPHRAFAFTYQGAGSSTRLCRYRRPWGSVSAATQRIYCRGHALCRDDATFRISAIVCADGRAWRAGRDYFRGPTCTQLIALPHASRYT